MGQDERRCAVVIAGGVLAFLAGWLLVTHAHAERACERSLRGCAPWTYEQLRREHWQPPPPPRWRYLPAPRPCEVVRDYWTGETYCR
jgi:hypothetical protein